MKSKAMQKLSSDNSILEKFKRVLRVFAFVFAFVFTGLYFSVTGGSALAIVWTFLTCIAILIGM